MVDYKKRLVEVDEILNHIAFVDYEKIPINIRNMIHENKDDNYRWQYDETKELKDQNVSRDTIAIISYLSTKYILNEAQRKFMKQQYKINQSILENEKKNKYNTEDIFKNKKVEKNETKQENINLPIEIKKRTFFSKLIQFFKKMFNK